MVIHPQKTFGRCGSAAMQTLAPRLSGVIGEGMKTHPNDFEFAPGFWASDWRKLKLDPATPESEDWVKAITMFRSRIQRRFLDAVDALIVIDKQQDRQTFGFAVLAIDFLVMETLEGIRRGKINHKRNSRDLIPAFLKNWDVFRRCTTANDDADALAESIYEGYRCALHHTGRTGRDMIVGVSGPPIKLGPCNAITINRTRFHEEVKREFNRYLDELAKPANDDLRRKFQTVIDNICG